MKRLLTLLTSAALTLAAGVALAQVKISDLPAAGALTGTEIVPLVQGGDTERTTTAAIAALAGGVTLANGTYTPSCTAGGGMTTCTGTVGMYIRVGNQVSTTFSFNSTGPNAVQSATIAAPINSAMTGNFVGGTCSGTGPSGSFGRISSGGANLIQLNLNTSQTSSIPFSCSAMYIVN